MARISASYPPTRMSSGVASVPSCTVQPFFFDLTDHPLVVVVEIPFEIRQSGNVHLTAQAAAFFKQRDRVALFCGSYGGPHSGSAPPTTAIFLGTPEGWNRSGSVTSAT